MKSSTGLTDGLTVVNVYRSDYLWTRWIDTQCGSERWYLSRRDGSQLHEGSYAITVPIERVPDAVRLAARLEDVSSE